MTNKGKKPSAGSNALRTSCPQPAESGHSKSPRAVAANARPAISQSRKGNGDWGSSHTSPSPTANGITSASACSNLFKVPPSRKCEGKSNSPKKNEPNSRSSWVTHLQAWCIIHLPTIGGSIDLKLLCTGSQRSLQPIQRVQIWTPRIQKVHQELELALLSGRHACLQYKGDKHALCY